MSKLNTRQKIQLIVILVLAAGALYLNVLKKDGTAPPSAPAPAASTPDLPAHPVNPGHGGSPGGKGNKNKTSSGRLIVHVPKGDGGFPGSSAPRGVSRNPFDASAGAAAGGATPTPTPTP